MDIADYVKLFINGREAGVKKLKNDCIAWFSCIYENGVVEAAAFDARGRETGRAMLKTAGEKTQLWALPEQSEARAGHLCYVRLFYGDEEGIIKPIACGSGSYIRLKAEGNGCLTEIRIPVRDITESI